MAGRKSGTVNLLMAGGLLAALAATVVLAVLLWGRSGGGVENKGNYPAATVSIPGKKTPFTGQSNTGEPLTSAKAVAPHYVVDSNGWSIFHPPPVVSAHLTGIANNPLSFPVRFITSLAGSVGGQTVAIGTEGQGLVMFRPAARPPHRWVEFHPNNKGTGFPSWNVYSVCFDSQGRLWVGTLRKGIVVGKLGRHGWQWRHYDEICRPAGAKHPNLPHQGAMTFNGPLGCHVFAIAEDPLDKSIWISTEAGISVYYPHGAGVSSTAAAATAIMSPVQQYMQGAGQPVRPSAVQPMPPMLFGRWRYITPADGLPASPVDCMAFDSYGNLFVGTQCNGIAAARPQDGYSHWRRIGGHRHVTTHGTGRGLPSNLINALLIDRKTNHIYAATDWGLGISDDDGASWHYIRGQDYAAKVAQLWHVPKNWQPPNPQSLSTLLPGDHVTSLAEDSKGRIWLGTWRNGYAIYQSGKGVIYHNKLAKGAWRHGGDYVNALLPVHLDDLDSVGLGTAPRVMLVGKYGSATKPMARDDGLSIGWQGGQSVARQVKRNRVIVHFPQAALPPTRGQLAAMLRHVRSIRLEPMKPGQVVALPADWRTEGDWEGNYGKYYIDLFAFWMGGDNLQWRTGPVGPWVQARIGPHRPRVDAHDVLGFWPIWLSGRESANALLIPYLCQKILVKEGKKDLGIAGHRQAEVDDEGESSPPTQQGPGLCNSISVPPGYYIIAPYEMNCIGHDGINRQRDCRVEVHSHSDWGPAAARRWKMDMYGKPVLARERVADFSNGVWQPFLVRGPATIVISIRRNYSYTTPESGLAMDYVNEHPAPYYYGLTSWNARLRRQAVARAAARKRWDSGSIGPTLGIGSRQLVAGLLEDEEFLLYGAPKAWGTNQAEIYTVLLRRADADGRPPRLQPVAARLEYRLALFNRWNRTERKIGIVTPRHVETGIRSGWVDPTGRETNFNMDRWYMERLKHAYPGNDPLARIKADQWLLATGEAPAPGDDTEPAH